MFVDRNGCDREVSLSCYLLLAAGRIVLNNARPCLAPTWLHLFQASLAAMNSHPALTVSALVPPHSGNASLLLSSLSHTIPVKQDPKVEFRASYSTFEQTATNLISTMWESPVRVIDVVNLQHYSEAIYSIHTVAANARF